MHLIQKKTSTHSLATVLLTLAGALTACGKPAPEPLEQTAPESRAALESTCGDVGLLAGSLSGAINVELEWLDNDLRCESMLRPNDGGVRLRFTGEISGERLAIIIALPGLEPGTTGDGFDSNVTITVEDSGRFFSTPRHDTCWSDITAHEPLPDHEGLFNVVGGLSCVGPLGEFNGDAFVDVRDLRFSGVVAWSAQ